MCRISWAAVIHSGQRYFLYFRSKCRMLTTQFFFKFFFLKYSGEIFITCIFQTIKFICNIKIVNINIFIAEIKKTPYMSASPALRCAVVPASNHTGKNLLILQSCTHRHYRHYLPLCRPKFLPAIISLH